MTDSGAMEDRRKHPRILLLAYGFNHKCVIRLGDGTTPAQLIDISPGGARIRLSEAGPRSALIRGVAVYFNAGIAAACLNEEIPAKIRWVQETELGLAFDQDLPLTASDLQRHLSK